MSEPVRPSPLDGKSVLIVEDEVLVAFDLIDEVNNSGAQSLGPALTVKQAFDMFLKEGPDAAILDINLRGESIYPFARTLIDQDIPFVFHSGHGTVANLEARFPDIPICAKPASPKQLIDAVAGLMA